MSESANVLAAPISSALPTEAGFYWWRETERAEWRMLQVVDCGGPQYLNAYDVQHGSFGGRGLRYWDFPIGQWVKVHTPK